VKNRSKGKSTGPKTPDGKSRSSRNSRTHGFFAKELRLSKTDVPEFDALRSAFQAARKPSTAIQLFLFDDLVACAWRMKIALRYEHLALQELSATNGNGKTGTRVESTLLPTGGTRRDALNLIREMKTWNAQGTFSSNLSGSQQRITGVLGESIWKALSEWDSASPAALALAEALYAKAEAFNLNLPASLGSSGERRPLVRADLYPQVIDKILNLVEQGVTVDIGFHESRGDEVQKADLWFRYHAKARRDFYQALAVYDSFDIIGTRQRSFK
jgi:hypothetical protein